MIHICVRQTLDWHDEALVRARLLPQFRAKFDVWNATLDMPYHLFRARLTQIAQRNLDRVEGATCSRVEEVPAGAVIVPVDDDDWFAPDLANRLRHESGPGVRGYLWRREAIEPARRFRALRNLAKRLGRREKYTCKTNNYAIVCEPALAGLASSHVSASRYFDANPQAIRHVSGTLAIQNRSLASMTTLAWGQPSIRPEALIALLNRYRELYASWKPGPELRWASPYVENMVDLMREIRAR